jgi:pyruvate formate-lyase activating enzyme-like uncharacterized protein
MNQLEKFVKIIREQEERKGINTYLFVYSNGILANEENLARLKDWGVQEIRFHLAASNFSEDVFKNWITTFNRESPERWIASLPTTATSCLK